MTDRIETATSGRAKCRACRQAIAKGELRFGESGENPYGDGEATLWYHPRCAALRRAERFAPTLTAHVDFVPQRDELLHIAQLTLDNPKLGNLVGAGYAPTARARCQQCRKPIAKGELRIVLERLDEGMSTPAGFLHAACGVAYLGEAGLIERLKYCVTSWSTDEFDLLERSVESGVDR